MSNNAPPQLSPKVTVGRDGPKDFNAHSRNLECKTGKVVAGAETKM